MKLTTIHKITISTAIAGGVAYFLWATARFFAEGATSYGFAAGISLVLTAALARYLYRFNAQNRDKPEPVPSPEPGDQLSETSEVSETE